MKIAVLHETGPETRVAAIPETVKKFVGLGAAVAVEKGAGNGASIADTDFEAAGGTLGSRADVLKDKERYVRSWQVRSYRLLTETIRASCNESQSSCQVSGLLEFNLSNPATVKTSAGTSSFEYGIRFGADGGRIFSENGKIQSARK